MIASAGPLAPSPFGHHCSQRKKKLKAGGAGSLLTLYGRLFAQRTVGMEKCMPQLAFLATSYITCG